MIAAIEAGEALEVCGVPGMFSVEEVVDFALGGASGGHGGGVGVALGFDCKFGGGDVVFLLLDGVLEGFDAGVAGQVVEALGGDEDVALHVVHNVGEAFGKLGAGGGDGGGEGGGIHRLVLWSFGLGRLLFSWCMTRMDEGRGLGVCVYDCFSC